MDPRCQIFNTIKKKITYLWFQGNGHYDIGGGMDFSSLRELVENYRTSPFVDELGEPFTYKNYKVSAT